MERIYEEVAKYHGNRDLFDNEYLIKLYKRFIYKFPQIDIIPDLFISDNIVVSADFGLMEVILDGEFVIVENTEQYVIKKYFNHRVLFLK